MGVPDRPDRSPDRRLRAREGVADRWLPGEYEVIPNGVLVPAAAPAGGREHRVVFAGRQEPRKGLQVLLRAWPEIRSRTGLRLPSRAPTRSPSGLLLARLRVSDDGIDVVGFLSQEELTDDAARAKALIAPSIGQESFGMVLTRAFACALPVVASDIPGYREVLDAEGGGRGAARTTPPRSSRRSRRCRGRAAAGVDGGRGARSRWSSYAWPTSRAGSSASTRA